MLLKMNYWLKFHSHQNWSPLKLKVVHRQSFHHHHHHHHCHQITQSLHTDHLHPLRPGSVDILDFWQTGFIRTTNFKIVLSIKRAEVKDYPQYTFSTHAFQMACIHPIVSFNVTVNPLIGHSCII